MFDTRKLSETLEEARAMPRDSKAAVTEQDHALRVAEIQTQIAIAEQLFRVADVTGSRSIRPSR